MNAEQKGESVYMKAYWEAWKESDEYQAMNKAQVKRHLETVLSGWRLITANIKGRIEGYAHCGITDTRIENLFFGNDTQH